MSEKIKIIDAYPHPTSDIPIVDYEFDMGALGVKKSSMNFWLGVSPEEIKHHLKIGFRDERRRRERNAKRLAAADVSEEDELRELVGEEIPR